MVIVDFIKDYYLVCAFALGGAIAFLLLDAYKRERKADKDRDRPR